MDSLVKFQEQSSDELFDLKVKAAELNVLLSPYREIYEVSLEKFKNTKS